MPTADATLLPPPYSSSTLEDEPHSVRSLDAIGVGDVLGAMIEHRRGSQPSFPSVVVPVTAGSDPNVLELLDGRSRRRHRLRPPRAEHVRSVPEGALTSPPLLKLAFDWAAVWHKDQNRKYPDASVPYMSHVAGVAAILSRHGFAEQVVAAGALHDVMEDCGVTHEELVEKFGDASPTSFGMSAKRTSRSRGRTVSASTSSTSRRSRGRRRRSRSRTRSTTSSRSSCARASFGDPWKMFKRGRTSQLGRFRELSRARRRLPPHALIDEFAADARAKSSQLLGLATCAANVVASRAVIRRPGRDPRAAHGAEPPQLSRSPGRLGGAAEDPGGARRSRTSRAGSSRRSSSSATS